MTSGTSPKSDVSVDIKIGLIRFCVASIIASGTAILSSFKCRTVCSIIRIALFTTIPVRITKPNIVSISSGWRKNKFKIARPAMPPALATGITNKMIAGRIKLRNSTTNNRKMTPIAVSTFNCMAVQVLANSLAAPFTLIWTDFDFNSAERVGRIVFSICSIAASRGTDSFGRS